MSTTPEEFFTAALVAVGPPAPKPKTFSKSSPFNPLVAAYLAHLSEYTDWSTKALGHCSDETSYLNYSNWFHNRKI